MIVFGGRGGVVRPFRNQWFRKGEFQARGLWGLLTTTTTTATTFTTSTSTPPAPPAPHRHRNPIAALPAPSHHLHPHRPPPHQRLGFSSMLDNRGSSLPGLYDNSTFLTAPPPPVLKARGPTDWLTRTTWQANRLTRTTRQANHAPPPASGGCGWALRILYHSGVNKQGGCYGTNGLTY